MVADAQKLQTKRAAERIPFEVWSDIAACLSDDKDSLYSMSLLSRSIYAASQSHLYASVDIRNMLQKQKSQAVSKLASTMLHHQLWADNLRSVSFPWLTPHLAPQIASDAFVGLSAACQKLSSVEICMEYPPKHDWTSATATLREALAVMPNLAKISYKRSKECPFLTFIRTMDTLSCDGDFCIEGKKGSRLGKVDLGLLRSQEDVHQSLIALEPRTYLFSAKQVIVRVPPFPAVATIQAVAALFICESLSLSMACQSDKATAVLSQLADKVVDLHLNIAIVFSTTQERLNIRLFKHLRTLKISPKMMEWHVVKQLLESMPDNLETLDIPYFSAEIADFYEEYLWRVKTGVQASNLRTLYIPAEALTSMKNRLFSMKKPDPVEMPQAAFQARCADIMLAVQKKASRLDSMCVELGIAVRPYCFQDALAV